MTLLEVAELFEKAILFEISKSHREGDDEGARMKTITLNMVRDAIVAEKERR
jgi:hypothetical protein